MFRSNTLWTEPLLSVSQKVTLSIVILVGARPFALVTLILTGTTFPTAPQYSFVKDKPINSCSALSAFSWKARDTSNDVGHPLLFSSLVWQIWWAGVHSVFVQDPESHCNSCTSNRRIQVNLRAANIHQILQQTNTHTHVSPFTTSKSDQNQKKSISTLSSQYLIIYYQWSFPTSPTLCLVLSDKERPCENWIRLGMICRPQMILGTIWHPITTLANPLSLPQEIHVG